MRTALQRLSALVLLGLIPLFAENWPGFRGTYARGVAENANLPVSWNVETGAHIAWKTEIPGLGLSSPVVWDDVVFLTTAISSNPQMVFESKQIGMRDDRQDPAEQEFRVLAIDKRTGRILWNQLAVKSKPRVLRHPHNSYASPTPATDGSISSLSLARKGYTATTLKEVSNGKKTWASSTRAPSMFRTTNGAPPRRPFSGMAKCFSRWTCSAAVFWLLLTPSRARSFGARRATQSRRGRHPRSWKDRHERSL